MSHDTSPTLAKLRTAWWFTGNTLFDGLLRNAFLLPALFFLVSFVLFVMAAPGALSHGDAAVYLQQIRDLDFAHRTIHLGYFIVGSPFIHLLPFPSDYGLNLMSCIFGSLCVALLCSISQHITGNRHVSIMAGLLLLTNYPFVYNAVFAEVYVPQLCFVLLSITLLLANKPIAAGFSFALSFLITPSAIFGLALLLPFRRNKQLLARFISTCSLVIAVMLFPHISDYITGGRGLINASSAEMSIHHALMKEAGEFFSGMYWYIPFLLIGVRTVIKEIGFRDWGTAMLLLWFVTLTVGERFGDVPVQLPTYAFACVIMAIGMNEVLLVCNRKSIVLARAISILLLLGVSGPMMQNIMRTNEHARQLTEYRDTILSLNQTAAPGFLAIGDWSQGILFEHYLYRRSYTGAWMNTEWLSGTWGTARRDDSRETLSQAIRSQRELWLLNYDSPLVLQLQKEGYAIHRFRSVYRAVPVPALMPDR